MKEPRAILKSILLIVFLLCSATLSFGQGEKLNIAGTIVDEEFKRPLQEVQIHILRNGSRIGILSLNDNPRFDIDLPLGFTYDIQFKLKGYGTKILRFDTQNIPPDDRIGGFGMNITLELFPLEKGFDKKILREPIGISKYDREENNIVFDFGYTEKIQARIQAEHERLAAKKKRKE